MATPQQIRSGVGLRHVQIFALNSTGYIAASATSAYEGLHVSGSKALTLNHPDPRFFTHTGDDGPFMLDVLPPTEAITGELRTAKTNDTVDAAVTGQIAYTLGDGEMRFFGEGTNQQGEEPDVGLLAYKQTRDTDPTSGTYGQRRWEFYLMPKVTLHPKVQSMAEDVQEDKVYTLRPLVVTEYPWGTAFTAATEGYTRAQAIRGVAEYEPKMIAFEGDGTTTQFVLPTAAPAATTAKMAVWVDGVIDAAAIFVTTQVSFTSAPSDGAIVTLFYEKADD